jgi:hypothetical protein
MHYAIVDGAGLVINVTEWDGAGGWVPPDGTTAVQLDGATIGGTYIGGVYTPPPPPVLTPQQVADAAARAARAARNSGFLAETSTADLAQQLKTATSAQIDTWIDNHVANLVDARNVLKLIVKILATQID